MLEYLARLHGMTAARGPGRRRALDRPARSGGPGTGRDRGAVARQPAAGAAGRGAGARARAAGARRAVLRPRPGRRGRHERGAGRAGRRRGHHAVLQPSARPGRAPVPVGGDHRPRPAGRRGQRRGADPERPAAGQRAGGGRPDGHWAQQLGRTWPVEQITGGTVVSGWPGRATRRPCWTTPGRPARWSSSASCGGGCPRCSATRCGREVETRCGEGQAAARTGRERAR